MSGFNSITDEELQRKVDDAAGLFLAMEANPDRWYALPDHVTIQSVGGGKYYFREMCKSLRIPGTDRGTYATVVNIDGVPWAKWFDVAPVNEARRVDRMARFNEQIDNVRRAFGEE